MLYRGEKVFPKRPTKTVHKSPTERTPTDGNYILPIVAEFVV